MEFKNGRIVLDKALNNLDRFVLDFVAELKDVNYVLVSGYVSILFGRSRISEDIDVLVPEMKKEEFLVLHERLLEKFWCLNTEETDELFDLLLTKHSIRYARREKVIPNMEVKFALRPVAKEALAKRLRVDIGERTLFVSPIDLQIAYKEIALRSDKDKEDALHLREVFAGRISEEKVKYYERMLEKHGE